MRLFHTLFLCFAALFLATLAMDAGPSNYDKDPRPVALVYSDIKLDDKAAIYGLLKRGKYRKVVVVFSGIQNFAAANSDLKDFLEQLEETKTPLTILYGSNMWERQVEHEVNFQGAHRQPYYASPYNKENLERAVGQHEAVDVFQIAPTPEKDIELIKEAGITPKLFYLLHGYNSRQFGSDKQIYQYNYVTKLRKIFPPEKGTSLYFSNNWFSYPKGTRTIQPFETMFEVMPQNHLNAAANDPFHRRQIKKLADDYPEVRERLEKFGIKLQDKDPAVIDNSDILHHKLTQARLNTFADEENKPAVEDLRQFFKELIGPYVHKEKGSLTPDRIGRLTSTYHDLEKGLGLELTDAHHINAILTAQERGHEKLVPMVFEEIHNEIGAPIMRLAVEGEDSHGMGLINANFADNLPYLKDVFRLRH